MVNLAHFVRPADPCYSPILWSWYKGIEWRVIPYQAGTTVLCWYYRTKPVL